MNKQERLSMAEEVIEALKPILKNPKVDRASWGVIIPPQQARQLSVFIEKLTQ